MLSPACIELIAQIAERPQLLDGRRHEARVLQDAVRDRETSSGTSRSSSSAAAPGRQANRRTRHARLRRQCAVRLTHQAISSVIHYVAAPAFYQGAADRICQTRRRHTLARDLSAGMDLWWKYGCACTAGALPRKAFSNFGENGVASWWSCRRSEPTRAHLAMRAAISAATARLASISGRVNQHGARIVLLFSSDAQFTHCYAARASILARVSLYSSPSTACGRHDHHAT